VLVGLAAFCWGIDNTVSTKLVGNYEPLRLVALKGLLGGGAALGVALVLRQPLTVAWPEIRYVAYIGLLGVAASIVLFYHALRRIGATLTSGLFLPATALAGVLGGWSILGEELTVLTGVAAALALVGAILVVRASSPATNSERGE
jgi:O-acetylserine/cysteine efflux transporter